jgi:hypothetical protein
VINSAIVMQWGTAIPGRENMGLEVFMSAVQYYDELKQKGEVEDFQTVLFEQGNISDHGGLMIVSGSRTQLQAVLDSERYRELIVKALHIVSDIKVQFGATGTEAVQDRVQELTRWRKELGL